MSSILFFSNKLKNLGIIRKFQFQKLGKWFYILFSRKRRLEEITFNYFKNWHFDNAYLVVDIVFKNGIWYKIGGYKSILSNKPIVIDLANIKSDILNIEVYGFFQKKELTINLNKVGKISSESYNIKFSKLSAFNLESIKIKLKLLKPELLIKGPNVQLNYLKLNMPKIEINHNLFQIQDYL